MNTNSQGSPAKSGFGPLFKNVFRRHLGIALLYTVLCFVSYPLIMLLIVSSRGYSWVMDSAQSFIGIGLVLMGGLAILFSMILTTRLYGYMHTRPSVDVYHAMPVKRSTFFWIHYLVGLILVIVPFVANVLITLVFYQGPFTAHFIMDFFLMLLMSLISITEWFTFCVFFHVTCGTSFGANLYNLLLNIGYLVAMGILSLNLVGFLPGYKESSLSITSLLFLAPIGRVFSSWSFIDTAHHEFGGIDIWIHLGLLVVLLLLSFFLYRNRKSEAAGDSFAFSLPKHILRFIVTSGGALFFSLIFYSIYNDNREGLAPNAFPIFLGAFIGGALTHIILEIIFSKGFGSLFKSLPAFALFCVTFTAAYLLLVNGWFGYDTWIPKAEEINRVSITCYTYDYRSEEPNEAYEFIEDDLSPDEYLIKEAAKDSGLMITNLDDQNNMDFSQKQNIASVLTLHDMAVRLAAEQKPYIPGGYTPQMIRNRNKTEKVFDLTLTYHMKNGKTMSRNYYLPLSEQCSKTLESLRYSPENLQYYLGFTEQSRMKFSHRVVIETEDGSKSDMEESLRNEFLICLEDDLKAVSTTQVLPNHPDTIRAAVFVTVTNKNGFSDIYPEVWLSVLKINPTQYPKTHALLLAYQAENKAA